MKKFLWIALVIVAIFAGLGYVFESEEPVIVDDKEGGFVVKSTTPSLEQAPASKNVKVLEGEDEQIISALFYRSQLGYSTYVVEKFQVEHGENCDRIISEIYPQNEMIVTLMPEGTRLADLRVAVETQLTKDYSQISALKEITAPLKSLQVDALDGTKGHTRVYLFNRKESVYKIELFFDEYGTATMLPRFCAMMEEMRF